MKFHWFHLMPYPYLPDDFKQKYHSVWVDPPAGERFDPTYLSNLSDDTVPAIAAALPRLDAQDRAVALAAICVDPSPHHGWAAANRARSAADRTREALTALGHPADARAEALSPAEWRALWERLC